jgi:hypothetical protein
MFKNSNKAILAAVGAALLAESGRADIYTVSFTNVIGNLTYGAGGVAFSGTQPGTGTLSGATSSGGLSPTGPDALTISVPQWDEPTYTALMNKPGLTAQLVQVTYTIVGVMYGVYEVENTTSTTIAARITFTPGEFSVTGAAGIGLSPAATVDPGVSPINSNWDYVNSDDVTVSGVNNSATIISAGGVPNSVRSSFNTTTPANSTAGTQGLYVRYDTAQAATGAGASIPIGSTVTGTTPGLISTLAEGTEDTANLSLYEGSGNVDLFVLMDATGVGIYTTGFGSVTAAINPFVGATVVITYTYVPETGTLAAAGAMALGAGITIARQRRSKV